MKRLVFFFNWLYLFHQPGPKIYVFSPSGEIIETHPTPFDRPTNCTFGGKDLTTLYVTTGQGYLLMAHTERKGRLNYPA